MLAITANIKTKMVYKEKREEKIIQKPHNFHWIFKFCGKKIAQNNENSRKQAVSLHS